MLVKKSVDMGLRPEKICVDDFFGFRSAHPRPLPGQVPPPPPPGVAVGTFS